jgi:hypothetical protein
MPRVCWRPNSEGRYIIDVAVGGLLFRVMVDTGIVDTGGMTGFEFEAGEFDLLDRDGRLSQYGRTHRTDASGNSTWVKTARTTAQLLDPTLRTNVGPQITLRISRGMPGVVSRVGVVFFHHLTGYRVEWDLTAREWCVEYP